MLLDNGVNFSGSDAEYSADDYRIISLIGRVSNGMGAQGVDGSYSAGFRRRERDGCGAEASALVALVRLRIFKPRMPSRTICARIWRRNRLILSTATRCC